MHSLLKQAFVIAWLALLGFFLVTIIRQLDDETAAKNTSTTNISPPPLSHFDPDILRILTLGYPGLYHDFADLWMMQILTNSENVAQNPKGTDLAIQFVTNQRPKIETFYMLSCLIYLQDLEKPEACEKVIRTGLELFPNSFRLPMLQGYIFTFVMDEPAKAALYYSIAAARKNAPPYVARLVRKLENKASLNDEDRRDINNEIFLDENPDPFKDFFQNRLTKPNQ